MIDFRLKSRMNFSKSFAFNIYEIEPGRVIIRVRLSRENGVFISNSVGMGGKHYIY